MAKRYILLENILEKDPFFTPRFFIYSEEHQDHTKLIDGTVAYKVIGYANTVEEAQIKLYGRTYNHEPKAKKAKR